MMVFLMNMRWNSPKDSAGVARGVKEMGFTSAPPRAG